MNVISATAFAMPSEGMNDLHQKIYKYVYEIQMIELDEYLFGMNRRKIDTEKAYKLIIDAPDSESNAIFNIWKGRLSDPRYSFNKSNRVEKDGSRAEAFYQKALDLDIEGMAEAGDKYAQTYLGWMYRNGHGMNKNLSLSVKWFRKAAEQGHADAQRYMGIVYFQGQGVDENYSSAMEWYRKAAEQGHAGAQTDLGLYQCGSDADQNYSLELEWYRKAADQGYGGALWHLGMKYEHGMGVEQNYRTAVEWYGKAAEQGHADSLYKLGEMYENGRGVDKNVSSAMEWYRKAAEQGYLLAQRNLDRLTKRKRRRYYERHVEKEMV